jgi:uncharacterized protein
MESDELAILHELSPRNDELRHLWGRHQGYERDLGRLDGLRYPSEAERREIGKLKRMKLRGKERMQAIIDAHRNV